MIRILFLLPFLLISSLSADVNQKLFDLYQKGMYEQGCDYGYNYFSERKYDEPFISLLGFSCLKADKIDRLSPIITTLRDSSEARANSAYFALLVLQKKLLMQALYDHKPMGKLKLPTSSHLLSKVFDLYTKTPKTGEMIKEYQDSTDPRLSYKLYTTQTSERKSIAVDEYYDKILTVHHVY